jgi:hypothetical protein
MDHCARGEAVCSKYLPPSPLGEWMIWNVMIYLLTAIGLTPGSDSTVHIYTQTIHRKTQWNTIPRMEHT